MDYEPTFRPTFRAVIRDLHSLFTPGQFRNMDNVQGNEYIVCIADEMLGTWKHFHVIFLSANVLICNMPSFVPCFSQTMNWL